LPPTSDFLYQESDNHKECVENPNAYDGLPGEWIPRHTCMIYLDDNKGGSESNYSAFPNNRHHISRQAKQHRPENQGSHALAVTYES